MVAGKFICWITESSGAVRRVVVVACGQQCAIRLALSKCPGASSASCRRADRQGPPRDALADLARRAGDLS